MRTITITRDAGSYHEIVDARAWNNAIQEIADMATDTPEQQTEYHTENLHGFFDHAECKGHANFVQGSHVAFTATIEDIRRDKLGDPAIGFVKLPDKHDVVSVKIEYYPVFGYGRSTYHELHDQDGNLVDDPKVEECVEWYCQRVESLLMGWAEDTYLYYHDEDHAREYADEMNLEFYLDTGEIVR